MPPIPSLLCGFVVALLLCSSLPLRAETRSVGPGCQHADVQSAIDALAPGEAHEVRIVTGTYTRQTIDISARRLRLRGGFASCQAMTPTGSTTLSGLNVPAAEQDSVVSIRGVGNDIVLEDLVLSRGDEDAGSNGGGLDFDGTGALTLRRVAIADNYAGYGGGINFRGAGDRDGERATLLIDGETVIRGNTAQRSGGGIRVDGHASLWIRGDGVLVSDNTAIGLPDGGYGGGIMVLAPAEADIGSPGLGTLGTVVGNRARHGGGLAVLARESVFPRMQVRLYSEDASRPITLARNHASQTGGAIYVLPFADNRELGPVTLCAFDFALLDNSAQNGSAAYVDTDYSMVNDVGGTLSLGPTPVCPIRPQGRGAAACVGPACNRIAGNVTRTDAGAETDGATLLVQDDGYLGLSHVRAVGNRGGTLVRSFAYAHVLDSLLADNTVSRELIRQDVLFENAVVIDRSTIVGNAIGADRVITSAADTTLSDSILWQPGKTLLVHDGGLRTASHLLVSERASLVTGEAPTVVEATPRFIDATRGDYRPTAASPAVDFGSQSENVDGVDLDGAPRLRQLVEIPDRFGRMDVGAFERPAFQPLVLNAHFDQDLRYWSEDQAGASTHDPSQDAGGSPTSGALRVAFENPPVPMTARTQCLFLPVAGRYALNASGRSSGAIGQRDFLSLRWELRHSALLPCGGRFGDFGSHGVSASSGWLRPTAPAIIDVPSSAFGPGTHLAIRLVATESGNGVPPSVNGWFDDVTLELQGAIPPWPGFGDGFEQ